MRMAKADVLGRGEKSSCSCLLLGNLSKGLSCKLPLSSKTDVCLDLSFSRKFFLELWSARHMGVWAYMLCFSHDKLDVYPAFAWLGSVGTSVPNKKCSCRFSLDNGLGVRKFSQERLQQDIFAGQSCRFFEGSKAC